jgi:hypothetical protein
MSCLAEHLVKDYALANNDIEQVLCLVAAARRVRRGPQ